MLIEGPVDKVLEVEICEAFRTDPMKEETVIGLQCHSDNILGRIVNATFYLCSPFKCVACVLVPLSWIEDFLRVLPPDERGPLRRGQPTYEEFL